MARNQHDLHVHRLICVLRDVPVEQRRDAIRAALVALEPPLTAEELAMRRQVAEMID